jgi:hypothetical protein
VDAAGRIYVADGQAREIRVFDARGRFVRRIGSPGRGPGELRWPAGLALTRHGSRLLVTDYGNARWSVFDTAGALLEDRPRPLARWTIPWPGRLAPSGRLLEPAGYGPFHGHGAPTLPGLLLGLDSAFTPVDTFPFPPFGREVDAPFSPEPVWRLDGRGHLWFAGSDRYRIVERGLSGDTLRVLERDVEPDPISEGAKEEAARSSERRMRSMGWAGHVDRSKIPDHYPLIEALWVDERGDLWVVPYAHDRASPVLSELDVFGPEGRYLGRVRPSVLLERHFPLPVFRGDDLYAVTEDDLGVEYVVRLRIEPPLWVERPAATP